MHVQLTRENADTLIVLSHKTNRSVGELANLIISSIASLEIEQVLSISLKPRDPSATPPNRPKVHRFRRRWTLGP
jgi:hypothetical protein